MKYAWILVWLLACDEPAATGAPDLPLGDAVADARLDDARRADTGGPDAVPDAQLDARPADAQRDLGPTDAGPTDAAPPDAAPTDAAQPDAAPPAPWLVRSERVAEVDAPTLRALVAPGVAIENGYEVYQLRLRTGAGETSATVTVPDAPPPAAGWHVVINAHGTTGADDHCALVGTDWAIGNAGLFGARGLIGVAVEYPGLDGAGPHPYLVSASEGPALLDAARATLEWAAAEGVPTSGRVALVGFSQGGHAALAAAAAHRDHAPALDLAAVAVAAPASVWPEHWASGLAFDGPHLVYHALLAHSWSQVYRGAGAIWGAGVDPAVFARGCVFDPAGADTLSPALPAQVDALFDAGFARAWRTLTWGDYAWLGDAFAANRVGPYPQSAPLRVYQGDADRVVPVEQTEALVAALRAGGVAVEYERVEGGAHDDVAFGVLAFPQRRTEQALAWLRARLDALD